MGFHGVFHGCLHVIFVGHFFFGELQSYQDSCLEDEVYKKSPLGWLCVPGIPVLLPLSTQTIQPICRSCKSQVMAQPYGSQAWLGFPQVAATWIHGDPKTGGSFPYGFHRGHSWNSAMSKCDPSDLARLTPPEFQVGGIFWGGSKEDGNVSTFMRTMLTGM